MRFLDFKNELKDFTVFSTRDMEKVDPHFHNQRLSEWIKKGYLKKITKKFYIFSDLKIDETVLFLIANKIFVPSYISLEMALSYYNLIPEGVYGITSVCSQKTKHFNTEIGTFMYHHIKPELMFGYTLNPHYSLHFKMADIEKSVLDYLYLNPGVNHDGDFSGMRFNASLFEKKINREKLLYYLAGYGNNSLKKRLLKFLRWLDHA